MITSVTDALALLGVVTAENNQFKREQMKDRLPAKMQPLAKNVPPECKFGNDLSKRINQLSSMNTALIKTSVGKITDTYSNNSSHEHQQSALQKTCILPGGTLLKGRDSKNLRPTNLSSCPLFFIKFLFFTK